MARKQASHAPWPKPFLHFAEAFLDFVEANPQLAAAVAFQVGNMAGQTVTGSNATGRALAKRAKKVPQQIADALPSNVSALALKFLPGPSPKLQPRKRAGSKLRQSRKSKVAS
jgi:hypothetical protein